MKRILNLEKSPKDIRDYPLSAFLDSDKDLPIVFSSDFNIEITDQLRSDMCLAFQLAYLKSYHEGIPMSPGWIYYFAHLLDPRENKGGLYPVYAFKALQNIGIAKKEDFNAIGTFDHVENQLTKEIYQKIIEYSKEYGIKNWVRISNVEDMKRAIVNNGYIVMAIPVYQEFFDAGSFVGAPDLDGKMFGGHAVGAKGYNEKGFETINSWGKDWGINGKTNLGYDYPIWEAYAAFDLDPEYPGDIKDHWAEDDIQKMIKAGFLNGYPDGNFKPDQPPTRAELATILTRILEL